MIRDNQNQYKWIVLSIATAGQAAISFGGLSIPPLAGYLTKEFTLSKTEFGAIMSIMYLGAAIFSFPSGRLTDILGVKKFLSVSLFGTGLFVAMLCLTQSYIFLLVLGFLIGLGYGTTNPVTNKAVMEWFQRTNRGTAMSIKQTSVPLGGLLAAFIMAQLAVYFGWRPALLIGGIGIILLAGIPWRLYKSPQTGSKADFDSFSSFKPAISLQGLLTERSLILLSLIASFFSLVQIATGTYLVLFLEQTAFFTTTVAASYLGLANAGGIIGRICWGIISDRFFGGRRRIVLQIIACISGLSATLICFFPSFNAGKWFFVAVIFILGFTAIGWNGVFQAYLVEIAGKSLAGTGTGVSMSIVFLGNVIGPIIFGGIVDLSGSYKHAWEFIGILMSFSIIILFMLKENVPHEELLAT